MGKENRNSGIDFMRTLAILIMLVANTLPYAEFITPPDWLRLLCSLAAPLFVFLSGYSVHLSKARTGWSRFLPAISVFLAAILVDVVAWRIIPLLEFDVLYLISNGLFINALLRNSPKLTVALAILLMVFSPFALSHFSYRFEMDELSVFNSSEALANWLTLQPVQRFLVDGWFPLFPWLSIALFGSAFAQFKTSIFANRKTILSISIIGFACLASIQLNGSLPSMRDGYVEIFYPLGYQHMLLSVCWIVALSLWLIPQSRITFADRLNTLGRKSQLVYITHAFFLGWLIEELYQPNTLTELSASIVILFAVVLGVSTLSERPSVMAKTSRLPATIKRTLGL